MIRIIESVNKKEKTISIKVNDSEGRLAKLLDDIKKTATIGHTFEVVVDPKDDKPRTYEMDGDGSFRIDDVSEDEYDSDEKEKKEESIQKETNWLLAMDDVVKSMRHLSELWENPSIAKYLDNDMYPFDKSFDELVDDVYKWAIRANSISVLSHNKELN